MTEPVELTIAGQSCRVVSSASAEELERFAAIVESKLAEVNRPGRPLTTQTVLLAAIALAHDVEEQRQRADEIVSRAKVTLSGMLERVDQALAFTPEEGEAGSPKKSKRGSKRGAAKKSTRGATAARASRTTKAKTKTKAKAKAKTTKA